MSAPDGPEERTAFYEESYERDELYSHTNEYGEIIAHSVTVYPVDAAIVMDKITTAVKL